MKFRKILSAILMLSVTLTFSPSSYALSKLGSTGAEVRNIQSRLKSWGYYNGAVDGIYGTRTQKSVMRFQANHGLTPDGIAGAATLARIGLPTGSSSSSGISHSKDKTLLAMIINGEARGESYEGQVAVGAVVLNRVRHSSFPNTIAGVIYQPGAFTAVDDGQVNAAIESSCFKAAQDALNGWDPSGGAIYYYNPATATSSWIWSRPVIKRIGKHVFCK